MSGTHPKIRHIENVLTRAGEKWDFLQIKDIRESEIDDFFIKIQNLSSKTCSNYKAVLHDFWSWVVRRERRDAKVEMPIFPDIHYKLGWRTIVSMEDQAKILDEIWNISSNENPRIWLGIKLLSLFPKVRPGEMRNVKEGATAISRDTLNSKAFRRIAVMKGMPPLNQFKLSRFVSVALSPLFLSCRLIDILGLYVYMMNLTEKKRRRHDE